MVQDIAEKESIKVLEKATVPIVKMTDKYSDVKASTFHYTHQPNRSPILTKRSWAIYCKQG